MERYLLMECTWAGEYKWASWQVRRFTWLCFWWCFSSGLQWWVSGNKPLKWRIFIIEHMQYIYRYICVLWHEIELDSTYEMLSICQTLKTKVVTSQSDMPKPLPCGSSRGLSYYVLELLPNDKQASFQEIISNQIQPSLPAYAHDTCTISEYHHAKTDFAMLGKILIV